MRILVTGASGFAGSLLVPRLLADGHELRALGREPGRVRDALERTSSGRGGNGSAAPAVEVVRGDALTGAGLAAALDGVQIAYYLIHSMEPARNASPAPFAQRERIAAENFATAAAMADCSAQQVSR